MLFLSEEGRREFSEPVSEVLAHNLPYEFHGYPTNFAPPDPQDRGVQLLEPVASGPVNHRVSVQTIRAFVIGQLGFDNATTLEPADWLTFSEQRLLTLTSGPIYHDELGLREVCSGFAYYPRDVWLYQLAVGWTRIGQEEHLMGCAGLVGDEAGAAVIGARLVRDVMRLCFMYE
jgi:hypothetical protein